MSNLLKKIAATASVAAMAIVSVSSALAATSVITESVKNEKIPYTDLGALISTMLQVFLIIAGLGAFAFLLIGGFQYITSGGEKAQAESARDKITHAIMGLVIIVAAYAGIRVIETIFGISIVSGINWPGPVETKWAGT